MSNKLRVHYFQHIAGEGYGSCEQYLKAKGAVFSATEFYALPPEQAIQIDALPQVDDVDLLIIMGGDMSVNDELRYPWLKVEKQWIRQYISLGKPAVGLCLGGQLIANAFGTNVQANRHQELGWFPVKAVQPYPSHCFQVPPVVEAMHWHSETFGIPDGAQLLMSSEACQHQLYQLGDNVLGFQFHPEITPSNLGLFLEDLREIELFSGPYVDKHLDRLKATPKERFQPANRLLEQAIDYVLMQTKAIAA